MKNNNKSYGRCMFNQMKIIFATHFLHILQGQASGFHTLISQLNSCKDSVFNILRYHGPYRRSYKSGRLDASVSLFYFPSWTGKSQNENYSMAAESQNDCFIISRDKLFLLEISVPRTYRFLWCTVVHLKIDSYSDILVLTLVRVSY